MLAILVQLGLQPALSYIGIQEGLSSIETATKDDDDKRHHCQVPEGQPSPYALRQGNAETMLCRSFHGSPSLRWRLQAIPNTANRGQQFDRKRVVDFATQAADVHINHIRFAFKVIVPDMLLDQLACDYLVRVIHQVFKQRKLFWRQLNRPPFSLDGVHDRIDHQATYLHLTVCIRVLAT